MKDMIDVYYIDFGNINYLSRDITVLFILDRLYFNIFYQDYLTVATSEHNCIHIVYTNKKHNNERYI